MVSSPTRDRQDALSPEESREIREKNSQVWEMVDNLIHPTAIYVLLQLVILSHLSRAPALIDLHPLNPIMLGIYACQFAGAWAVFYTTLLRDMGLRCPEGTILLLTTVAGIPLQYLIVPHPQIAGDTLPLALLGIQMAAGLGLWARVFLRWRRARQQTPEPEQPPR